MKKSFLLAKFILIGLCISLFSCNDDSVSKPVISIDIPESGYSFSAGDTIKIKPEITSTEEASFIWLSNNEEICTDPVCCFTTKKSGKYTLTLKVSNSGGEATIDIPVEVLGKYENGTFILNEGNMSNETGIISFINSKREIIDSVYIKENSGHKLGNVTQDMWIANGKIYFVSQNGPNFITIVDAKTMKLEKEITEGFDRGDWPTHIVVCSNTKAYVRDNSGLSILDLSAGEVIGKLEGSEGANKQKMEFINNRAIVPAKNNLLIIDPTTDNIIKKIDMGGSITGIIEGKDKCIWAAVCGKVSEFVKVETSNFSIEQRDTLPNSSALSAGWIPSIGLCASMKDNSLFWRSGSTVYKHTTQKGSISTMTFIDFKVSYTDANMIYGDINIDPVTNDLYVCTIKGYGMAYLINDIYVLNAETAKLSHPSYKNHVRFPTGAFFTESFKN